MLTQLVIFLTLLAQAHAEQPTEELGRKLDGWTYRTSARPLSDQYADEGDRLTDGKLGTSKPAIWRGGTVTVDVDLGGVCRLSAIRIHQHRHNLNYKMDHLSVKAQRAGQWEERARQKGFVGPTPTMNFVHTLDLGDVETEALRLDFVGVGVLSLSEIELFGTRVAAPAKGVGAFPDVPFRTEDAVSAREEDLDGDGQPEVVLENEHVRLIFVPAQGGVCRSLRLKPDGTEIVHSRESGFGLLRDQLWKPKYSFGDRVYFHRVENTPDQASVELWTTGVGGMMSFTEIRKRITLAKGSPVARVHYTLTNEPSSQTDYEYGFWSHNWLGEVGAANTYFFPTTEGVKSFTLDVETAKKSGDTWYRNPARGWTAVASENGTGLAMRVPYKYLNLFYHWHGAGGLAATHEWRMNLLEVKAGEKLEWDVGLIPLAGLPKADGAIARIVAQVDPTLAKQTGGDILVASRIEPECERLGKTEESGATRPGHEISTEVVTPHVPWAKPTVGGKIRALVLMDDMNCREAVELAQRIDLELDYVKFRTTLAKELLYQGDLSILTLDAAQKALLQKLKTRQYDVILLAGFKWDFHFTPEIRKAMLNHVRAGTGLVLIQPDGFDEDAIAELPVAGVAKEGAAARNMGKWCKWAPATDHPLVNGLDWDRFPVTRRHEYSIAPEGDVLATIGDDGAPLLTIGELGEGRVVSATWDVLTHDMSYRGYSALTPILSYRGGWLRPEFASLPSGYHEWWFALLTRMTAWAAGRDTGVSVSSVEPLQGDLAAVDDLSLHVTVHSDRAVPKAKVQTWWFNGIGNQRMEKLTLVDLPKGNTEVALPVPALPAVTAGDNTACFVVRDADGTALTWGFGTVSLAAPTRIETVKLDPEVLLPKGGVWQDDSAVESACFTPAGPLTVNIELSDPAPQAMEASVVLADTVGRGRHVGAATVNVPQGATSVSATFPPVPLVKQGIEARVRLKAENAVWDERCARAVAYRPRVWNRFWYTSWGGQYLWRTKYLFDFNSRLVRDWGVDVSFWGMNELDNGKVRDNAFWGINHSWLGLMSYFGKGVPDFMDRKFAAKSSEYAKTGDKQYLVRTPSLIDPEWRAAVRKSLLERTQQTMAAGGTYDYCMGDEMSLTHYTRFHDYDWSEYSLRDFRRWLKETYPSLDALNAAWSTRHATWDAVVPLTREEAREAANPAPWFEFRMYMNDQLAGFYTFVQDTIREVDPHARCGLSGTQSPEAGNGMDWWKLSKAFSYYHSYNTSWSNEMRRSFQRDGGADQSPYFSGYSATNPNAENRLWWCLFHDTRGISAWKTGLFWYGDFTETQSGRDTKPHLDAFRRGIWRLLRGAKRQHDGIAIYYSMPSIITGALTGEEQKLNAARDSWVKLIEDLGLQYEFVAYEQVADGILQGDEFKVVVLPYTLALSQKEADEVRAFVKRGGTLLATRPVGVRDDLGRPQEPGLLADVFGAHIDGTAEAIDPVIKLEQGIAGLDAGTEIRLPVALSNLDLTDGKPAALADDGVPALIAGSDGHARLLNLDLTHFEQERRFHSPTEKQLKAIVREFFADAGVKSKYPLTLESGKPSQVEVVRYQADGVEFLCLLNAANEPDVAIIPLGAKQHVYDVRAEAARGELDTLKVPLEPKCARLYCLSGEPLPPPTITAAKSVARGAALTLTVGRQGASAVRQLLRVNVKDATGRDRPELTQTVWVENALVESSFPLALNDPLGEWTLTATDVISGQTATVKASVE